MSGRSWSGGGNRFGFNGQELVDEIVGGENSCDLGARIYSTRLGKMLCTDPLEAQYPWQSSYAYFKNSPITIIDFHGMGDYYDAYGKHLGSDGKTKTITVGKGKNATIKEVADDKAYYATSIKLNEKGPVESAEGSIELIVSNTTLNRFANTISNESSGDWKESFSLGSAIMNLANYKGKTLDKALTSEGIYGYTSSSNYNNNAEFSMQAALNAVLGGEDFSGGAIRWDGYDFAARGFNHPKAVYQGIHLTEAHIQAFKTAWPDKLIKAYSGGDYTAFV